MTFVFVTDLFSLSFFVQLSHNPSKNLLAIVKRFALDTQTSKHKQELSLNIDDNISTERVAHRRAIQNETALSYA